MPKEMTKEQNHDADRISEEKRLCSKIRKARRTLLSNADNLSENMKAKGIRTLRLSVRPKKKPHGRRLTA
jgi:hypothetical protein